MGHFARDERPGWERGSPITFSCTKSHSLFHLCSYVSSNRTVCIHNSCFSPENAQMQLTHTEGVITFFSVARTDSRKVISFHVVCGSEGVEDKLRKALVRVATLENLIEWLESEDEFSACSAAVKKLIDPLAGLPRWSSST